jgi:hypothetical protein
MRQFLTRDQKGEKQTKSKADGRTHLKFAQETGVAGVQEAKPTTIKRFTGASRPKLNAQALTKR